MLLLAALLCCAAVGCTGANTASETGAAVRNPIEENTISTQEALYLLEAEYDGSALPQGQEYRFTYLRTETRDGISYYVYAWETVDEQGELLAENSEILVAADGSHTALAQDAATSAG